MIKLHKETGISRSHLYGIFDGRIEPKLSTYSKILTALGYSLTTQRTPTSGTKNNEYLQDKDYLVWNIAYYGGPLIVSKKFKNPANIDQVILSALTAARKDARLNAILPYFIYANWDKITWNKIFNNTSEKRYLAYLINLISHFTNDLKCSRELIKIDKLIKPKKTELLIKNKISPFEREMLRHIDNKVAKTWKFLTADQLTSIESRFYKWGSINQ